MTPIHVGWRPLDDPHELDLRAFGCGTDDFLALARVRNSTLQAITLPEEYRDMSAAEMQQYYYRADFDLAANA
ncbi:MAG TPA: hypothetical protein VGE04_20325 [Chloroflexia bacterium]